MGNILMLVLENLEMVASLIIPFLLVRIADIIFGVILAIKDETLTFDYKVLLYGILNGFLTIVGVLILVSGVAILPELLEYYSISIIDPDVLSEMVNVVCIVSIIITSIISYGKDAYLKLVQITQTSSTSTTTVETTADAE